MTGLDGSVCPYCCRGTAELTACPAPEAFECPLRELLAADGSVTPEDARARLAQFVPEDDLSD